MTKWEIFIFNKKQNLIKMQVIAMFHGIAKISNETITILA